MTQSICRVYVDKRHRVHLGLALAYEDALDDGNPIRRRHRIVHEWSAHQRHTLALVGTRHRANQRLP